MANWLVNTGRKDLVEETVWTKGNSTVKYQTLWRSGSWYVTTTDESEPQYEADDNGIVELGWAKGPNIKESQFEESYDGCGDEWIFSDDMDEAERTRIEDGWYEDHYTFMEEDGWVEDDTYWYASKDELQFEPATD